MEVIAGLDELKTRHPGFELWHLHWVEDLRLYEVAEPENDALPFSLVMTMRTEGAAPTHVRLAFEGVFELRLGTFHGSCFQMVGFDIQSVSDRGWEHGRWEVVDFEDGRIHFYCQRITIEVVNEPKAPR